MQLGLAGTGRMGTAMALRLLDKGHSVTVWNRTRDKTALATHAGAAVATSPTALVAASDKVITILTNAAAMQTVYGGPDGVLSGGVRDKLFIHMSTARRGAHPRLAPTGAAKGPPFLEC